MNAYGAPASILDLIEIQPTPLLAAVAKLGPERIQWLGPVRADPQHGASNVPTCWGWGGEHKSETEILAAAKGLDQ
jgi:hypothetical protein